MPCCRRRRTTPPTRTSPFRRAHTPSPSPLPSPPQADLPGPSLPPGGPAPRPARHRPPALPHLPRSGLLLRRRRGGAGAGCTGGPDAERGGAAQPAAPVCHRRPLPGQVGGGGSCALRLRWWLWWARARGLGVGWGRGWGLGVGWEGGVKSGSAVGGWGHGVRGQPRHVVHGLSRACVHVHDLHPPPPKKQIINQMSAVVVVVDIKVHRPPQPTTCHVRHASTHESP